MTDGGWNWDLTELPDQYVPPTPPIPGVQLGDLLGSGGMGHVFRGIDATGREVAVKLLLRAELTPDGDARFRREAELLARLTAPGIMRVHAWGETPEAYYLVCELVEGEHLDVAARTLDTAQRMSLIVELCEAVGRAHQAGIVHRDLKPSNLLVGPHGHVKVIDFGLSKAPDQARLTRTDHFIGTPLYAPPEMLGGEQRDDPRIDVWMLGAIAFELLAGRHPYPIEQLLELAMRTQPPPPLDHPEVPAAVEAAIRKALSPDPQQRYPHAAALGAALAEAQSEASRAAVRLRDGLVGLLGLVAIFALIPLGLALGPREDPPPTAPGDAPVQPPTSTTESVLDHARSLLRQRRWAELRDLLAPRQPTDPPLRRQLGLALLYTQGPDAARPLLPGDQALIAVEVRGRELAALLTTSDGPRLLSAIRLLLSAAETIRPPDDPAVREGRARAQRLLLRGMTVAAETAAFASLRASASDELLRRARLLAPGLAPRLLDLLRLWTRYTRIHWPTPDVLAATRLLRGSLSLFERPLELGALPELAPLAPLLEMAGTAPGKASPALRARAAAAAAALDEDLAERSGSRLLRGAVREALALEARNEACRLLRSGETKRGLAEARRGEQLARAGLRDRPYGKNAGLLIAQLILIQGHVKRARKHLRGLPNSHMARVLLNECDVAQRFLRRRVRHVPQLTSVRGANRRLRIHRLLLRGQIDPAEALARFRDLKGTQPEAEPLTIRWLEWRSEASFEDVLRGGWWPGKKAQ